MQGDLPPVTLHKPHHHWLNAPPNCLRSHLREQSGFRGKQIGQQTEQCPKGGFCRSGVNFVLRELGKSKASGACSIPPLFAGTQKSFDDRR